jgi:hypothetical protein
MTDTTKFASPVNDVKPTNELSAAVDEVDDSMRRKPGRWGAVGAGLLAAVAAAGVLRWRRRRQTPKSRAARAWHRIADPVADRVRR